MGGKGKKKVFRPGLLSSGEERGPTLGMVGPEGEARLGRITNVKGQLDGLAWRSAERPVRGLKSFVDARIDSVFLFGGGINL